jgi:hypothetical protein
MVFCACSVVLGRSIGPKSRIQKRRFCSFGWDMHLPSLFRTYFLTPTAVMLTGGTSQMLSLLFLAAGATASLVVTTRTIQPEDLSQPDCDTCKF